MLRDFAGKGSKGAGGEIVVLNDEAHHCYQDKLIESGDDANREDKARNADAREWFKGLRAIAAKVGITNVYDPSATPYYLSGSGYYEGFIFPWVVSDFSLMDAIESGIVKVPRVPVDDDAAGDLVTYLNLWEHVKERLPKRLPKEEDLAAWVVPEVLEAALERPAPQLREAVPSVGGRARPARRAPAGDDRGLPQHHGVEARLRLDRRRRSGARRHHRHP